MLSEQSNIKYMLSRYVAADWSCTSAVSGPSLHHMTTLLDYHDTNGPEQLADVIAAR